MKKYTFLIGISFLVIAACKKNSGGEPAFQWPEGTGEYAPYTLGSTFTYEVSTTAPASVDSTTYTVTKDTTIDGLKFKKLASSKPTVASDLYVNYNNGIRTDITLNTSFSGVNVPVVKLEVLKDGLAVNGTWSGTLNVSVPVPPPINTFPVAVAFNYTIMQKDFTKNILAKDYTGTITVKQVATLPSSVIPFLPVGTPSTIQIDNFFSKGVGLSQRDAPNTSFKIKRYNVVK
jgi:hypothetical protein